MKRSPKQSHYPAHCHLDIGNMKDYKDKCFLPYVPMLQPVDAETFFDPFEPTPHHIARVREHLSYPEEPIRISRIEGIPRALYTATGVHSTLLGRCRPPRLTMEGLTLGGTRVVGMRDEGLDEKTMEQDLARYLSRYIANLGAAMTMKYGAADLAVQRALELGVANDQEEHLMKRGGGNSIILVESMDAYGQLNDEQQRDLFRQHGAHMLGVNNRERALHITVVDIGSTPEDMSVVARVTGGRFVACQREEDGGTGDPSPGTAKIVWAATKAALGALGRNPEELTYAIQGVGAAGSRMVGEILGDFPQVTIYIADNVGQKAWSVLHQHEGFVTVVPPEQIYHVGDVFMPCAGPYVLNRQTLAIFHEHPKVLISGSANDLFAMRDFRPDPEVVRSFHAAGIPVVPDPLGSMGGIGDVEFGFYYKTHPTQALSHHDRAAAVFATGVARLTEDLFRAALRDDRPPYDVFEDMVVHHIARQCLVHGVPLE